ncbi:MAG: HPr(Ser) kinase/phosphatase [Christensenellales bacterium]|nr:HPr(Ser) kinase/phosphatase [Christensenellales bacterium]
MVKEADFVKGLGLERILPTDAKVLNIEVSNANRPGMQFANYWDFFAYERPQLLGKVEMTYLSQLDDGTRRERLAKYFTYPIPCLIISRGYPCFDEMLVFAAAHKVPIYSTKKETTAFELEMINFLLNYLAPRETRHGVLVNVFGTGLLITGNSGVGKSEAALELIKRGHQLVADDVVDIKRVGEKRLVGESPELVRHFMEIRGVGIIDIATMYGAGSIIRSKSIDMEVHLEMWQAGKEYDRLGMSENFSEILGVKIPTLLLPIHPGRNLAVVLEVAARNFRMKQMGYNAAMELARRHMERAQRADEEE